VNFCLKVQLDANQKRCVLEIAFVVYSTFDDVALRPPDA
jgi:hypothetical protein